VYSRCPLTVDIIPVMQCMYMYTRKLDGSCCLNQRLIGTETFRIPPLLIIIIIIIMIVRLFLTRRNTTKTLQGRASTIQFSVLRPFQRTHQPALARGSGEGTVNSRRPCSCTRPLMELRRHMSRLVRVADLPGRRSLRSARTNRLLVPSVKLSTVGGRSFPVAGPTTWNSLPDSVISAPSLSAFRQRLKTLLFSASFYDIIIDHGS